MLRQINLNNLVSQVTEDSKRKTPIIFTNSYIQSNFMDNQRSASSLGPRQSDSSSSDSLMLDNQSSSLSMYSEQHTSKQNMSEDTDRTSCSRESSRSLFSSHKVSNDRVKDITKLSNDTLHNGDKNHLWLTLFTIIITLRIDKLLETVTSSIEMISLDYPIVLKFPFIKYFMRFNVDLKALNDVYNTKSPNDYYGNSDGGNIDNQPKSITKVEKISPVGDGTESTNDWGHFADFIEDDQHLDSNRIEPTFILDSLSHHYVEGNPVHLLDSVTESHTQNVD